MSRSRFYRVFLPSRGETRADGQMIRAASAADAAEQAVVKQCCRDIVWRSYIAHVVDPQRPDLDPDTFQVNVVSTPIFKAKPLNPEGT